jgi:hypothetical protein
MERCFMLEKIGSGRDGIVYLMGAAGTDHEYGALFVVKFSTEYSIFDKKKKVVEEAANWNALYPGLAHIMELNNEFVLAMPKLDMLCLPNTDFTENPVTPQQKQLVKDEIERWAQLGIAHNDLEWRHVGMLGDRIIFADLADIKSHLDPNDAREIMLQNIFIDLQDMDSTVRIACKQQKRRQRESHALSDKMARLSMQYYF